MALTRSAVAALCVILAAGCSHGGEGPVKPPGMGLYFSRGGVAATLAYGRPNSDDVALVLECQAGSGQVDISDIARRSGANGLILTSGTSRVVLPTRTDTTLGPATLWARASSAAPVLAAFRRTGRIGVQSPGARYTVEAAADERPGIEQFFQACAPSRP